MKEIREAICKLPENDLASRIAWIRREILPLARGRVDTPEAVVFEFPDDSEIRQLLAEFIAFERRCCDGLGWGLVSVEGAQRLEIQGLSPDSPFLEGFPT